jgi:hypothetical protein
MCGHAGMGMRRVVSVAFNRSVLVPGSNVGVQLTVHRSR